MFGAQEHVIKLYPPSCADAYVNERLVLDHVDGALPLATPSVGASGALGDWRYIVMSRLKGRSLRACLNEVSLADRARLASQVGQAIGCLHHLDTQGLPRHDWTARVAKARTLCVARQKELGLDLTWLRRIEPFLDEVIPTLDLRAHHPLLHTEVMCEHVFVDVASGELEVTGLIDFEPSQCGPAEYELSSVGLFFSEGDGRMWNALLDGLAVPTVERGRQLSRRCMAWALLHRYANLRGWLGRLPARSARRSFDDLAYEWFSG